MSKTKAPKARTIEAGTLYRAMEIGEAKPKDDRTLELSFSSELPVERWFGNEILDHNASSVDLSGLNRGGDGGGPLLVDHDTRDQVGVVERAWIDEKDKKGRAQVRFGTSARANEIYEDVKGGIRRLVSVGYRVRKMVTEKIEDGIETMRATSWKPLELSVVAVPADISVGFDRGENNQLQPIQIMSKENEQPEEKPKIDVAVIRQEAAEAERQRYEAIERLAASPTATSIVGGKRARELAGKAIREGKTVAQFQEMLWNAPPPDPVQPPRTETKLDERETKEWSLLRALQTTMQAIENPHARANCYEFEVSQQVSKDAGKQARSFWIPQSVLQTRGFIDPSQLPEPQQRALVSEMQKRADLIVGTASLGGNVRPSILAADRFIDLLRNRMMVTRMGATLLDGLVGDVPIPRQNAAGTVYWAASEVASTTASNLTLQQITLTPKCATALQAYSKQLLIQSTPSIEQLVRNDLLQIIALAVDLAALHGAGSGGEPTGIIAVSGIGDVPIGTDGGAPTWAAVVGNETEVAIDNADMGSLGYLTNAKVRGKLKQIYTNATYGEIPLWMGSPGSEFGMLNGYRAGVSNQVKSNLTKGTSTTVCSALFFGNWADLLLGQWGPGIDVLLDPFTAAATRLYKMYADTFVDVQVRHPESFSATKDLLTT